MNLDSVAWSLGYRKCPECGYEYHESGTELCMCRPCEVADCDLGPDTICPTCGGEGKIFVTEVMVEE